MGRMQPSRRWVRDWPVVCAGRVMTLALVLVLVVLLIGRRLPEAWVVGFSLAAFAAYGYDKWAAQQGDLRLPEWVLLGVALLGGSPGALAGMLFFRHKTRKASFLAAFGAIVVVQAVVGMVWLRR